MEGGVRRTKNGYQTIAVGHAGEAYAHVSVAERALWRPLPSGAEVHHVNGDKLDNRPCNLVICQDKAYHKLLHVRSRIVRAGGDPNAAKICSTCKRLRPFGEFNKASKRAGLGLQSRCRDCQSQLYRGYVRPAKRNTAA
jgi:hypothetical protein